METPTLPVTVAATRRARPGRELALGDWAAGLCAAAGESPGLLRSEVRRQAGATAVHVTATLTFASAAAAAAWEASPARAALLATGDELTEGGPAAAPLLPPAGQQPRWRTALVVWAGLFPFALVLNVAAAPVLAALPVLLRTVLSTAVLVPLAVYVGIPAVQRLLSARRPVGSSS